MKSIGGFLGLEPGAGDGRPYHDTIGLSTGRSCLFVILQNLRPARVYLPYYVCDSMLQALGASGIPYRFYGLNAALEITDLPDLASREMLVYVNYFGLKGRYVSELHEQLRDRLIVDDTQTFFQKGYSDAASFNSARKFFGVPDGAYLYLPRWNVMPNLPRATPTLDHLVTRRMGDQAAAYSQFLQHESCLDYHPRAISRISALLLRRLDYEAVANRRRSNFDRLHRALGGMNRLNLFREPAQVPMCYPFMSDKPLRLHLIKREIFVPKLWREVETRETYGFTWEKTLAHSLSPLPIDQRYDSADMHRIIHEVKRFLAP